MTLEQPVVKIVKEKDRAVAMLDGAYRAERTFKGKVIESTRGYRSFEEAARAAIALGWG
jgi:hypothetical protein